ncbi:MAG: DUF4440 domain-containing protein [Pseudomonadota bacterium]
MTTETAAIVEIERLHAFISGWFRGEYAPDAFQSGFVDALHPEFVNIQPSGKPLTRAELLDPIRAAHGANPDFRITIEEPRVVAEYPGALIATYVEFQQGATNSAPENRRRSTALFETGDRLVWRHLQETGLPG